jgi:predicted  nucleic acid-binding Zn-ribbon protein
MFNISIERLNHLYESSKEALRKIENQQRTFSRDLSRVESLFLEIETSRSDTDQRFDAIKNLYKIHCDEYIPEITKYDRYLRETVVYFSDTKVCISLHSCK